MKTQKQIKRPRKLKYVVNKHVNYESDKESNAYASNDDNNYENEHDSNHENDVDDDDYYFTPVKKGETTKKLRKKN